MKKINILLITLGSLLHVLSLQSLSFKKAIAQLTTLKNERKNAPLSRPIQEEPAEIMEELVRSTGEKSISIKTPDAQTLSEIHVKNVSPKVQKPTVASLIYRGHSHCGKAALIELMSTPLQDAGLLAYREKMTQILQGDERLHAAFEDFFKRFASLELQIAPLFSKMHSLRTHGAIEAIYGKDKLLKKRSVFKRNLMRFGEEILPFIAVSTLPALIAANSLNTDLSPAARLLFLAAGGAFGAATMPPAIKRQLKAVAERKAFLNDVKKAFSVFQGLRPLVADLLQLIKETFKKDQLVLDSAFNPKRISEILKEDLKMFFNILDSKAFASKNHHHSNVGLLYHLLPTFIHQAKSFGRLFTLIGNFEALYSTACFMKEQELAEKKWCFVSYSDSEKPYLHLTNVINPFVSSAKSVANSIEIGGATAAPGVILNGPNTAGKTTFLKAILISIILAQSLGIAPAEKMTLTPFCYIASYLRAVDHLASGQSRYKAAEDRIKQLYNNCAGLTGKDFGIIVVDELFNSTTPREGAAAYYGFGHGFAELSNAMPLLSTHFPLVATLPEKTNGYFANYKVIAIKNPDGSFSFPYTILPGASHQVIALDLARLNGFDADLLDEAYAFAAQRGVR